MDKEKIAEIITKHLAWLRGEADGVHADLTGAYLTDADLTGADLRRAYLRSAYLTGADLTGADLTGADLTDADLTGADLTYADLTDADLTGADLTGADLTDAKLPDFQIVPEIGAFVGFKKCNTTNGARCIVTIEIPPEAKRTSSLIGRKCRAEFVKVLAIDGAEWGVSIYDNKTEYRVGEIVRADKFDDDIRVECSNGIHFFLTRKEAERYD